MFVASLRFSLDRLPGVVISLVLAVFALWLAATPWLRGSGFGALTLAMLGGLLVGNLMPGQTLAGFAPGLQLCKQSVLRLGVALYGLRLTVQQVQALGVQALLIDVLLIVSTLALAVWLGIRVLRMDRQTAILIGTGHAICGAAAILACAGVVRARDDQVAIAVASIVLFGTLGMLLYPWVYSLTPDLLGGAHTFGLFTGATLHEVAQVVAAGQALGPEGAQAAIVAKLIRVLMLAPVLVLVGLYFSRYGEQGRAAEPVRVPLFVLGFGACMLVNSWLPMPAEVRQLLIGFDDLLLAAAMAALGMTTRIAAICRSGFKPVLLGAALTFQLIALGALLIVL